MEKIKVFLIALQYQSNVVSTLINWLEVHVPLIKLHQHFSPGSSLSLHLLSSQWMSQAFSRTLGSVRFLCNPILNDPALPTRASFAVPPCVIQLGSPLRALEPLLSSSGRYNHMGRLCALCCCGGHMAPLFWEVQFCRALRKYTVLWKQANFSWHQQKADVNLINYRWGRRTICKL